MWLFVKIKRPPSPEKVDYDICKQSLDPSICSFRDEVCPKCDKGQSYADSDRKNRYENRTRTGPGSAVRLTLDKGPNPTYSWTVKRQMKAFAHILPKYISRKKLPKVKIPHAFEKYMKITGFLFKIFG